MGMKTTEKLAVVQGDYHLKNYDETYANFDWKEVEKAFSWYTTGKLNMLTRQSIVMQKQIEKTK